MAEKTEKDKHITIKATQAEKEMIQNKAEARGMNISQYLRFLALNDKV